MPKIKTRKAVAKKFRKKTASGLFMRGQSNKSHNTAKRSPKRKRQLRGTIVTKSNAIKALKKLIPYA